MPIFRFDGKTPEIHPTAYVHPTAVLTGDVTICADCFIGANASLRGDKGPIHVGAGAVIQDNCTVESFQNRDMVVEANVNVGQGCVIQGCRIGRNATIGRNSVVMNNVDIGEDCIIGAISFLNHGTSTEPGSYFTGTPARLWRMVSPRERNWKAQDIEECHELARRYRTSLQACEPFVPEDASQ